MDNVDNVVVGMLGRLCEGKMTITNKIYGSTKTFHHVRKFLQHGINFLVKKYGESYIMCSWRSGVGLWYFGTLWLIEEF